jgi:hypothetical protein
MRGGIEVPHEEIGKDGSVNWGYAVYDPKKYYVGDLPDFTAYDSKWWLGNFNVVFQQVRNPLKVVRSLPTMYPNAWKFIAKHTTNGSLVDMLDWVHIHPLVIAMQHYIHWNHAVGNIGHVRYQVEAVEHYYDLCVLAGFGSERCSKVKDEQTEHTSQHHRESPYENATWTHLYALHPELAQQLWDMAAEFGYCYEDVSFPPTTEQLDAEHDSVPNPDNMNDMLYKVTQERHRKLVRAKKERRRRRKEAKNGA